MKSYEDFRALNEGRYGGHANLLSLGHIEKNRKHHEETHI
jgi:hypothetical protein